MPDLRSDHVVLHLGAGKTGTSSLQYRVAANRDLLAEAGVLYPRTPGGARHTRLSLFAKSDDEIVGTRAWRRMGRPDPRRFRRRFRRRLMDEVAEAGTPGVLFSDEALFGLNGAGVRRLHALVSAFSTDVRAIVYLRRQDERLISRYQQVVKAGTVKTLAEWAAGYGDHLHDYHQRLVAWRDVLGASAVVVRRFEHTAFVNGNLYDDFLDAAGIPLSADQLAPVEIRNESLDAECVEFLRLLNLHHVRNEDAEPRHLDNTAVVALLRDRPQGPLLTLPDDVLDREMDRWAQSNRATAEEFLGDPSGVLFREPRRSGRTTTEQHLDEARIDELAHLTGIADEVRSSLHAIAAHEAERGRPVA